jgi:hypothetical protein
MKRSTQSASLLSSNGRAEYPAAFLGSSTAAGSLLLVSESEGVGNVGCVHLDLLCASLDLRAARARRTRAMRGGASEGDEGEIAVRTHGSAIRSRRCAIPREGRPPPREGRPPPCEGRPPHREGRPPPREGRPPPREGRPPPREGRPPPREGRPPPREGRPRHRAERLRPRELTAGPARQRRRPLPSLHATPADPWRPTDRRGCLPRSRRRVASALRMGVSPARDLEVAALTHSTPRRDPSCCIA